MGLWGERVAANEYVLRGIRGAGVCVCVCVHLIIKEIE